MAARFGQSNIRTQARWVSDTKRHSWIGWCTRCERGPTNDSGGRKCESWLSQASKKTAAKLPESEAVGWENVRK